MAQIEIHDGEADGRPVVVGCPWQVASGAAPTAMSVTLADGSVVPADVTTLNPVNAAGVQWLELALVATTRGEATVVPAAAAASASLASVLDDGALLANGSVEALLSTAADAALSLSWGESRATFAPEVLTADGQLHREAGPAHRAVTVLRAGAVRGQAEITGRLATADGTPTFHWRLTVEVWAGVDGARVDWLLGHEVPGVRAYDVARASLVATVAAGDSPQRRFLQTSHTDFYRPRVVTNPAPVALESNYYTNRIVVSDPAMLLDEETYQGFLPTPLVATQDWLALTASAGSLCAVLLDFTESRPNRLRSEGATLTYDLIPDGHTTSWPQGRRREQTLCLAVGPGTASMDARAMASEARRLDLAGRALPTAAHLAALNCFDMARTMPWEKGRNVRFSRYLESLCRLTLHGDKWDLGDTVDMHYTRGYAGIPNRYELRPGVTGWRPTWRTNGLLLDPVLEELVEPVWTNNEYDVMHALAQEACRAGEASHLQTLRWAARHNIEVDFVSYSDWSMHNGAMVAHSAHHNTTGAYPSHFWTQGLLQYYLLSGDRDALEVCIALGDKTLECLNDPNICELKFDREFGWGLLVLVALAEVTGIERFQAESDRIVDYLVAYDRAGDSAQINLSAGDGHRPFDRQVVDCAFGYGAMIEALDRYVDLTDRADVRAWFVDFLQSLRKHGWDKVDEGEAGGLSLMVHMLAIGYERTGDADFLQQIEYFIDTTFGPFGNGGNMGEATGSTKPCAIVYRALNRSLGHLHRADRLAAYDYPSLRARQSRES